ncbi:hypothetical protein PV10_08225 [Exophiala mesophila]|uniref:MAPEG family protein n=1 Tax=Exophiala mesophila TaxID=212818 RepID=A0A0D1Z1C4_EXOME|nr:uncharacterized protein PV10_08225 [Exophiala mesophila]KIV88552.1 hypothetical protein PV10_08225 [Exophiala mesophila]
MATLAGALGLTSTANPLVGNYAAHHAIFNFVLAYMALSARTLKQKYKLDHNVNPREDVARFGEKAVQDGKITREQLNMVKRNEAAHANSMEHYTVFVASILFATVAKVPNSSINRACTIYSVSRVAYGLAYIYITKYKWSYVRSTAWWSSNFCCFYLLWQSAQRLSSSI